MKQSPTWFEVFLVKVDHLNSILVGSNEMPFTAWKHTERKRQRDRKKDVMISWGFVIPAVQNNSLNDYLDTI